jgi:hypothetical protein
VDPRTGLDDVEKRKFLILPGLEPLPDCQTVIGNFCASRARGAAATVFQRIVVFLDTGLHTRHRLDGTRAGR